MSKRSQSRGWKSTRNESRFWLLRKVCNNSICYSQKPWKGCHKKFIHHFDIKHFILIHHDASKDKSPLARLQNSNRYSNFRLFGSFDIVPHFDIVPPLAEPVVIQHVWSSLGLDSHVLEDPDICCCIRNQPDCCQGCQTDSFWPQPFFCISYPPRFGTSSVPLFTDDCLLFRPIHCSTEQVTPQRDSTAAPGVLGAWSTTLGSAI